MLTHLLLWNYRPEVEDTERLTIEALLNELPALIPAIRVLVWGEVTSWRLHEYSRACAMRFADQAALETYLAHPARKVFLSRFYATVKELEAIDFVSAQT